MFVHTMTDLEKRKQAIDDINEVNRYVSYELIKKLSKEVKKFSKFPRTFKTSYITKNKNKYFLIFRCYSRNTLDKPHWTHSYTIMDSNEGKYAMIAVTHNEVVETFQIYAPHLFARYTERFGCDMYEEERIHRFMEDSSEIKYSGIREYEEGKVMSVVNGGVIFGDKKGDIIVFKTFVDEERLYDEQTELGKNIVENFYKRDAEYKQMYKKIKR